MKLLFLILLATCIIPPHTPTMVVFGDSIALGIRSGSDSPSYAALLAADQGMILDNRAVSGSVVSQTLELIRTYDGPATDAVWLVCANDLYLHTPVADFARRVQQGVDLLRLHGMRVYLNVDCPPFPRKEEPGLVDAYNNALRTVVRIHPVDVAEMPASDFHDGTHPNAAGHQWLAAQFEGAMRRRLLLPVLQYTCHCQRTVNSVSMGVAILDRKYEQPQHLPGKTSTTGRARGACGALWD